MGLKVEVFAVAQKNDAPSTIVLDTMELQNDPTFEARGIMQVMQHPQHGAYKMPAWPVRVDGAPPKLEPSPMLGQHNGEVLQAWLGMNPAAVETLKGEGVI